MEEFIKNNIEWVIAVIVVPSVTWFFTKRHFDNRQLKTLDLKHIDDTNNIYRNMLDDIVRRHEKEVEKKDKEIIALEKELDRIKKERKEERLKFEEEVDSLRKLIKKS